MILVGLGSNQTGPWGSPRQTVMRACLALNGAGLRLRRVSTLVQSAPFGRGDQPDFVNAVAEVQTGLGPREVLARLHLIERRAGRRRTLRWGPRTLDLDLLDYHGRILGPGAGLVLPHPGIAERIFVLAPIAEIAPLWRHPLSRQTAATLLRRLDPSGDGRLL